MRQKKVDLLQERLVTFKNEHEGQRQTSSKETRGKDCLRYQVRTSKLQREVRNIWKVLHAPEQRSHAVVRTASRFGDHSDVWKIRHPDGRIKNWVRDLACRLVTIHHLPITQAPRVVSETMQAIRANTSGNDDIDSSKNPSAIVILK